MNSFCYESFVDELLKVADGELEAGPNSVELPLDSGVETPAVNESVGLREDQTSMSDSVGDLASSDARRALEGLLKNDEGRQAIRETYNTLNRKEKEISTLKEAFTRGLLRARRDAFGPARYPVQSLSEILNSAD